MQNSKSKSGFGALGIVISMALLLILTFIVVKKMKSSTGVAARSMPAGVAEELKNAENPADAIKAVKDSTDQMAIDEEKRMTCQTDPDTAGCPQK